VSLVQNPILPGCHPDPSICLVGRDYYLVTSTFEYFPGLPVFHSTDLAHWDLVGHVVTRPDQLDYAGIASSGGLYAPTLRHHDGQFWVVCTLVDQDDPERGGNFLMTATDPAGPWSDPVWLDAEGIDPSVFFDDDGRVWMHGTRLAREPQWHHQTEVWLRELDPEHKVLVGPEHVIWTGAVLGAVWAEGPHLYKVDGTYYLLAAEGGTEIHHAVSTARASAVTGPYEGCRSNPVLTHRHLGRTADVVGVGHADLVQAVDGSWWAVLLAMRRYGGYHYPLGRETFLVPVSWEDGWPVFAPGVGRVANQVEVPFAESVPTLAEQGGGGGLVHPDDLRWTSLRGPANQLLPARGEGFSMRLSPDTLAEPLAPAFVGIRQQHRRLDFVVSLRAPLQPGEEAGLAIRQSERDHVRLALLTSPGGDVVVRAVHRRAGVEEVLGETRLDAPVGALLRLGMTVRDRDYLLSAAIGDASGTAVATADGRQLDSVATGGFLGLWLGIYGTSHGAVSATVLEIDRVDYQPA
jgi:alpha-N-arabinofuranosidase